MMPVPKNRKANDMTAAIGICFLLLAFSLLLMALTFALPLAILFAALVLGLFLTVFWICMLVSAIQNKGLTDGEKTGWVLGIVFLHILGSLLYFFIGRPKRKMPRLAT
jgi:hypothetical protein